MALKEKAQTAMDAASDWMPSHHAAADSNTIGSGGLS